MVSSPSKPSIQRALRFPEGLQLRPRGDQDTGGLHQILTQRDFQRYGCTLDPFTSIADIEGFLAYGGPNKLEIVAAMRDVIVGFAGLYTLPGRQGHVGSFTLSVHEEFQKIGIGTVLMMTIVRAGFRLLGLKRLQATVFTDNSRALSLYRRFGFTTEGTLRQFVRRDDGFVDAHLIAMVQSPNSCG